jgi:hypothetical protein
MRHTLKSLCLVHVLILGGVFSLLFPSSIWGVDRAQGPIALDPICELPEARNPPLPPGNPAASTRRMAELLAEFRAKAAPGAMAYMSDRMVTMLEGKLTNATEVNEKFRLQFQVGVQQVQAGRPDQALNTFSALEHFVADNGGRLNPGFAEELRMRKAVAFLRLGEQENCLATQNADSCVFPLEPKAYHLLPRGSRGAIALFNEQLAEFPDDLTTRWLFNLAHMTLGEYPDKVPQRFLIPQQTFAS